MDASQPLPRLWLMTDERLGDGLQAAVDRLPEGSGIVFRHYRSQPSFRRAAFALLRAGRPDLLMLLAGPAKEARAWGADGSHGRGPGEGVRSAPAHDLGEIREAEAAGAALIFLSPVFETRSHPGAKVLGADGFDLLAAEARVPVVALGGMSAARFALLRNAHGWAGVDAWSSSPS